MPRLTPVDWRVLEWIFKKAGFKHIRDSSNHRVFEKENSLRPIIIPKYNEVRLDIIKSNMRSANMTRDDYFSYLSKCK